MKKSKKYISNSPLEKVWVNEKGMYESDKFEVISLKEGNHIILVQTVGTNNGLPNQTYQYSVNANILEVLRKSDNRVFKAEGKWDDKNRHYATHFWFNESLRTISVAGYYTKQDKENGSYFSCNMISLKDLK